MAQEKVEREVKAKASEVPSSARDWLKDAFEEVKKPKWFIEYSQLGKAYESKFWWDKHFYSVKFDSLGNLMDVEIEIGSHEIPSDSWSKIQTYFSKEFDEYSVKKIQRQLTGNESDIEDYFDENEKDKVIIRYEIVFEGKKETWQLWEGLFDENGEFLSLIRVQTRSVDNLIF